MFIKCLKLSKNFRYMNPLIYTMNIDSMRRYIVATVYVFLYLKITNKVVIDIAIKKISNQLVFLLK